MGRLFKQVFAFKPGELKVSILLFGFFFLTMAVFQMMKPLKNGLFIEHFGAQLELYAKLLNIFAAIGAVAAFTYLYNGFSRLRLVFSLCAFFAVTFFSLGWALREPGTLTVWSFYLAGDLVATLMIPTFWAYLTDVVDEEQAARLFGVIAGGGVVGGWFGVGVVRMLLQDSSAGQPVFLSSALFLVILCLAWKTEESVCASKSFRTDRCSNGSAPELKESPRWNFRLTLEGLRLVLRSRYLIGIAGMLASYEITSQIIDFQFKLLSEELPGVYQTQIFMADVYFYANLVSVAVQLFLVSLLMRRLGLVRTLMVLPLLVMVGSTVFLMVPTLFVASLLVITDNGLNYSIQQTGRETLYMNATPDEKYKARAFISMFIQRLAKGFGVLILFTFGVLGADPRYLSAVVLIFVSVTLLCSSYAGRRYSRRSLKRADFPTPDSVQEVS